MNWINDQPVPGFSKNLILLNTGLTNSFETIMEPANLYMSAVLFVTMAVVLVIATYSILHRKKKKYLLKNAIQNSLNDLITELILCEDAADIMVPDSFMGWLVHRDARQIVIDELVQNKTSFVGSVSDNLRKLYYQFGLNLDSKIKLDDRRPYVQCQGIHELCVMDQKDQYRKIFKLTNSKDPDVRIEAQTAILKWYGFKGLRFLDVASYPISEFQQLKLLELLRPLSFTGFSNLNKWLASPNDTVVNFALKLAEHYKQLNANPEAARCLEHINETVRIQAVKTMSALGDAATPRLLTERYQKEKFTNRLNILRELRKVAGEEQRTFLLSQLDEGHAYLKLEAAKVLAHCTTGGIEILEARTFKEPVPYLDIYLHVKSETNR